MVQNDPDGEYRATGAKRERPVANTQPAAGELGITGPQHEQQHADDDGTGSVQPAAVELVRRNHGRRRQERAQRNEHDEKRERQDAHEGG
jgi:hypothetical protein